MRGKRPRQRRGRVGRRIIPAHAGQTVGLTLNDSQPTDHPRACGANGKTRTLGDVLTGSSPRMRGKRCAHVLNAADSRIIPAHAGQTSMRFRCPRPWSDHPRACGANTGYCKHVHDTLGSSPRMRGKQISPRPCIFCVRIIPAHAGQTAWSSGPLGQAPDHPRACGANRCIFSNVSASSGSSPRMRGKPIRERRGALQCRIIPAHAGQTPAHLASVDVGPDHPRACGANFRFSNGGMSVSGSSPRMRGKPTQLKNEFYSARIIPAHAGQTSPSRRVP